MRLVKSGHLIATSEKKERKKKERKEPTTKVLQTSVLKKAGSLVGCPISDPSHLESVCATIVVCLHFQNDQYWLVVSTKYYGSRGCIAEDSSI